MFKIIPAEKSEVTHLVCPHCKDKVPRVGLKKDSVVDGLTWTCRRCGMLWGVKADNNPQLEMRNDTSSVRQSLTPSLEGKAKYS